MTDINAIQSTSPLYVAQYEMNELLARQMGADLWDTRVSRLKAKYPEWGNSRPLLIMGLTAVQIVVAMVALLWVSEGMDTITIVLLGACGLVLLLLLYKATFYAMPFVGRWVAGRQMVGMLRDLEHPWIQWRLYDDRLETDSAVTHRHVPWSEVEQVQEAGQSMVLKLRDGTELLVPLAVLGEEACGFVKRRIAG